MQNMAAKPGDGALMQAIYSYQAQAEDELSINKGDQLKVVETFQKWAMVQNVSTEEEGYVPANYIVDVNELNVVTYENNERWWCVDIGLEKAKSVLKSEDIIPGAFLIRPRQTDADKFILCVKDVHDDGRPNIKNVLLNSNDRCFWVDKEKKFLNINALIQFYEKNLTTEVGIQLTRHLTASDIPPDNDSEEGEEVSEEEDNKDNKYEPVDNGHSKYEEPVKDQSENKYENSAPPVPIKSYTTDQENVPEANSSTEPTSPEMDDGHVSSPNDGHISDPDSEINYYSTTDDPADYAEVVKEAEPWWFEVDKIGADRLLRDAHFPKGTFIIRPSTDKTLKTLTVRNFTEDENGQVMHYRIQSTPTGQVFIKPSKSFTQIEHLLQYYQGSTGPHHICCKLHRPLRDIMDDDNTKL